MLLEACGGPAAPATGGEDAALAGSDADLMADAGADAQGSDAAPLADAVDATVDTAMDVAPDVADAKDAAGSCDFPAKPAAGEPGASCSKAEDCDSGFCVEAAQGRICTAACVSCCPSGFACASFPGNDAVFACMPKLTALCRPCGADSECAALSNGALCIGSGKDGAFCGGLCVSDGDCPTGYGCTASKGTQGASKQCVRTSGTCDCSPRSIADGAATSCQVSNAIGTCTGARTCLASGLSACDAPLASPEVCGNAVDDDCNGATDEAGSAGCTKWYPDGDGDGFGSGAALCVCQQPTSGFSASSGDCSASDPAIHPGAKEACNGADDNCNGKTDEGFADLDGDGIADCIDTDIDGDGVANSADCAPNNASVHPGAVEQCDGLDNNCDGATDEEYASGCKFYLRDEDGDGFGIASDAKCLCAAAGVFSALAGGDCNDGDAAIHPGAIETCDAADDNCDGATDPANSAGCSNFWPDKDADGYGSGGTQAAKCLCGVIVGYVPQTGDCDDSNFAIHPGAAEVCNGSDDNCDGKVDPANSGGCATYYADADGDGWGASGGTQCLCAPVDNFTVTQAGDCADGDKNIHPGATETCNGLDDNCDGKTDEGVLLLFFADVDGDGWGYGFGQLLCAAKNKFTALQGGDCNDASTAVYPGAAEICDLLDNNCDGLTDEDLPIGTYYKDADNDGYGNSTLPATLCGAINGYVAKSTDCDDSNPAVHPGAQEIICNGLDDDCIGGDSCDPKNCTVQNIGDFEGAFGGWTVGVGWGVGAWAKNGGLHGFGYGDGVNYPDSGVSGSAAATQVLILPGTVSIVLDYWYDPDGNEAVTPGTTRDTLVLTINGVTELNLNPYNDISNAWTPQHVIPVPVAWWGKTVELKFVFTTKDDKFNHGIGFAVDNIVTTCQPL